MRDFKKVSSAGDELVDYYMETMTSPTEFPDAYKVAKVRSGDTLLRLNPSNGLHCCPIRETVNAHSLLTATEDQTCESTGTGETYGALGSIRHEVCQQYLGRGGRIYGDWWCPRCEKMAHQQTLYKKCKCGAHTQYREMRFEHTHKGEVVKSFKIDSIYKAKDGSLWVIDYKFTSGHNLWKDNIKKLPKLGNVTQITDYVHTLRDLGGKFKGVKGWVLFYIGFESVFLNRPGTHKVVRKEVPFASTEKYIQRLRDRGYTRLLITRKAAKKLAAGTPLSKENIQKMLAVKPCKSREWYEDNMHDQYNPCPWAEVCHTKRMAQIARKDLNELVG